METQTQPAQSPKFRTSDIAEKIAAMLPSDIKSCVERNANGHTILASGIYSEVFVAVTDCGIDVKTRRGGMGRPTRNASWGAWDTLPKGWAMSEIAGFVSGQLF